MVREKADFADCLLPACLMHTESFYVQHWPESHNNTLQTSSLAWRTGSMNLLAMITGSETGGIGYALTSLLLSQGHNVIMACRDAHAGMKKEDRVKGGNTTTYIHTHVAQMGFSLTSTRTGEQATKQLQEGKDADNRGRVVKVRCYLCCSFFACLHYPKSVVLQTGSSARPDATRFHRGCEAGGARSTRPADQCAGAWFFCVVVCIHAVAVQLHTECPFNKCSDSDPFTMLLPTQGEQCSSFQRWLGAQCLRRDAANKLQRPI